MSQPDDGQRELRRMLEAAQGELARSQEALLAAKSECSRLAEELTFARWALEGGEPRGLMAALAEARAERDALRKQLEERKQAELIDQPHPLAVKVVLISTTDTQILEGASEPFGYEQRQFVGFVVASDRTSRDIVRTPNVQFARAEAERVARELNVPLEDLT
ncbi:MAG: hypothetical protein Q8N26_35090 [Myxococcales bacterium]|nr:hypothetical protein [Myxococcales bacterium]